MSTQKNEHNPEPELKPCPFCGSANIECAITIVDCRDCGAQADNAVIWNRRITPPTDTTGSGREGETPETDRQVSITNQGVGHVSIVSADFARQLERQRDAALAQVEALRRDGERLTWLIKQGPPGAAEGLGLNDEVWDAATAQVRFDYEPGSNEASDQMLVRAAIDSAQRQEAE